MIVDAARVTVVKLDLGVNRMNGSRVPKDTQSGNGSIVQLVPDQNPSTLYPSGIFLTLPSMTVQPVLAANLVTLKLKKVIPVGSSAGELRVYEDTGSGYGLVMDKTDTELALIPDDLSAQWKVDSTK